VSVVIGESAVDWAALGDVVVASLIAGVGITIFFSLSIMGATRFAELRRDNRIAGATAYGILAVAGLAATAASIIVAIIVMTNKG
jgi:hypothetical protein